MKLRLPLLFAAAAMGALVVSDIPMFAVQTVTTPQTITATSDKATGTSLLRWVSDKATGTSLLR